MHRKPHLPRNKWFNSVEEQIVELGTRLPSYFDDIFEPLGGDQRDARTISLKQRVGSNRGAVQQNKSSTRIDLFQGLKDGLRRIGRSRKDLQSVDGTAIDPNAIGESATRVDRNADWGRRSSCHARELEKNTMQRQSASRIARELSEVWRELHNSTVVQRAQ